MLGQTRARLGLPDSGGRLVLTRAHLLVIEHGDHLTRLDAIASRTVISRIRPEPLAATAESSLRSVRYRDHAWRNGGRSEEETPAANATRPTTTATATTTSGRRGPILWRRLARWL